jgi:hypothetical protein
VLNTNGQELKQAEETFTWKMEFIPASFSAAPYLMQCMQPDQLRRSLKDTTQFVTLQLCWTLSTVDLFNNTFSTIHVIQCQLSMMIVNGGLRRIWKETAAGFKLLSQH